MSRFFAAGDSSSESSSSDEEELYSGKEEEEVSGEESSEEEESEEESSDEEEGGAKGANRFLREVSSSGEESDEDAPKIVRSARDKQLDELDNVIKTIGNAQKIGDWNTISTGWFWHKSRSMHKLMNGQSSTN